MDRLQRTLAGCGLALLIASSGGCRSMRSNVPPGRPYTPDGRQSSPISFSSEPHDQMGVAGPANVGGVNPLTGGLPSSPENAPPQFGTPSPATRNYGAPTSGAYGAPGTSGLNSSGAGYGMSTAPSAGQLPSSGSSLMSGPGPNPSGFDPAATPPGGIQPGSMAPYSPPGGSAAPSGLGASPSPMGLPGPVPGAR